MYEYAVNSLKELFSFGVDGCCIWFHPDEHSMWYSQFEEQGLNVFIHVDAMLNEQRVVAEMDIPIEIDDSDDWYEIVGEQDHDDDVHAKDNVVFEKCI